MCLQEDIRASPVLKLKEGIACWAVLLPIPELMCHGPIRLLSAHRDCPRMHECAVCGAVRHFPVGLEAAMAGDVHETLAKQAKSSLYSTTQ